MLVLGPVGFIAPLVLWGLLALPVLWLLLRAVPPAPLRQRFPGVALLLGLKDGETETDRTPWWLLLLRMAALAALILAFARPVLNPQPNEGDTAPLLVLIDDTWAAASDWARRMDRVETLLDQAAQSGQPVALVLGSDLPRGALPFQNAGTWRARLAGLSPKPWDPDGAAQQDWAAGLNGVFNTYWLSDGLARPGRMPLLGLLEQRGAVTVYQPDRPVYGLRPALFDGNAVTLGAVRAETGQGAGQGADLPVSVIGPGPNGVERELLRDSLRFEPGADQADLTLDLPPELRNRVTRFELTGRRSAGAVALADDSLKRREVALIADRTGQEVLELLAPLHYLREALRPSSDLIEGALADALLAAPDVIVLADIATISPAEQDALVDWVEAGGVLLRFAGPRVAASTISRDRLDPLMPVRLRAGGRNIGGAMSWGAPKTLAPFDRDSPFFGLDIPDDVEIRAQVLAQPDPALAERTIARLNDGTPLVSRRALERGYVVLFHISANAEWSSLPLSGVFAQMLERLSVLTRPAAIAAEDLEGTTWLADQVLDGFGALGPAPGQAPVSGADLARARTGPDLRPGLYRGENRLLALNTLSADQVLAPATWPDHIAVEGGAPRRERALKPLLLAAALILMLADIWAALAVSGRLRRQVAGGVVPALALIAALGAPYPAQAQDTPPPTEPPAADPGAATDDARAVEITQEVVLAHVITGDNAADRLAEAGLRGLSTVLYQRTSIEPADPVGVDLETDPLALFPFMYWPVTETQALPSAAAYARLNDYLRTGGMILFDTRDADAAGLGAITPAARRLQQLAAPLDIPPLEQVPDDHVLTRTFYLLQDMPGRYGNAPIWVEAAPPDAEQVEGMPFRNLNDGVTPVIIGGNDWAAAWAIDRTGAPLYPVGRGYAGERQREIAYRFGVNLIMHVLTGNYKSDQVHVPALLDRLGQ